MKTKTQLRNLLKTLASAVTLVFFIWLAFGSGMLKQTIKYLGDGVYETTFETSYERRVITGKTDSLGRLQGKVVTKYYKNSDSLQKVSYTETAQYKNGLRNGESTLTFPSGKTDVSCYENDYIVDCNKSAHMTLTTPSAFEILKNKYPWYLFAFFGLGIQESKVKAYVDSIEANIIRHEFKESEFDDYYQNALDTADKRKDFDTISVVNSDNKLVDGTENVKNDIYRIAVVDHYRFGKSTFDIIGKTYPTYLDTLNKVKVTTPDFRIFCQSMDSLLLTYGPLVQSDPFYLDSIDARLYRALNYFYSVKKSALLKSININPESIKNLNPSYFEAKTIIKQSYENAGTKDIAAVLLGFMMLELFEEPDMIYYAAKEAYYARKSWVLIPTVATMFSNSNSNTSVTIRGRVIGNGGANVTARGIAYAATYNPTINDKTVSSGSGTGEFYSTISGLSAGVNYYARAYATNSKGTAYGNVISFNTATTSLVDYLKADKPDLKVFPNPASNSATFNIIAKSSGNYLFSIYNLIGQVIFSTDIIRPVSGEFRKTVNLSAIPDGIYTCILTNGVSKSECKLLIEH